jgi:hypothetical protein
MALWAVNAKPVRCLACGHSSRRQNLPQPDRESGLTGPAPRALDEICNWFTEGFDTAELKDAKALLDELSG